MAEYAKQCREAYDAGGLSKLDFVRCVLRKASENARDKDLVWKRTKALVELSIKPGGTDFILLKTLRSSSGIDTSATSGLWPWLKGRADVIEKKEGSREYHIRDEFLEAMQQALGVETQVSMRSILELQGLGKDIWAGIDAQDYVNHERSTWAG